MARPTTSPSRSPGSASPTSHAARRCSRRRPGPRRSRRSRSSTSRRSPGASSTRPWPRSGREASSCATASRPWSLDAYAAVVEDGGAVRHASLGFDAATAGHLEAIAAALEPDHRGAVDAVLDQVRALVGGLTPTRPRRPAMSTRAIAELRRAGIPHVVREYEVPARRPPVVTSGPATASTPRPRSASTRAGSSRRSSPRSTGSWRSRSCPSPASSTSRRFADALGGRRAELADPAAAERATGYVVGGISPIGQRRRLPTVLDASAAAFETILVSAGRRGLQVEIAPGDLVRVTAAIDRAHRPGRLNAPNHRRPGTGPFGRATGFPRVAYSP